MSARKDAIARLFRQFPKEATPQRLAQVLDDVSHLDPDDLGAAADRLVRTWQGKKAPLVGDIVEVVRKIAAERAERTRTDAELAQEDRQRRQELLDASDEIVNALADREWFATNKAALLDYARRIQEVWQAGRYVPPNGVLGRVLATMYVHHERGIGWQREPDGEYMRALEAALIAHERQNEQTAEINWWSDWKEAQGWA